MSSKGPKDSPRRRGRPSHQALVKAARQSGAMAAKVINPSTVETADWVRWKCRFGCDCYGSSLVCPPRSRKSSVQPLGG